MVLDAAFQQWKSGMWSAVWKACRAVSKNIFIHPPFNHSFLKLHFKVLSLVSGGQDWELHTKAGSKKKKKLKEVMVSFACKQREPPQQRSQRLSRGPSSHGDLSCSCVATAATQVRLPGCLVACGAPEHLGQCGKHGWGIVGDGGDRATLPFHTRVHTVTTRASLYRVES